MSEMFQNVPSPVTMRADLEMMVGGDPLGPACGPEEELTERNVRDRYLVGVLAPRPQPQPSPAKVEEEEDEETPALPDELSEGGADTVTDKLVAMSTPAVRMAVIEACPTGHEILPVVALASIIRRGHDADRRSDCRAVADSANGLASRCER